MTIDPTAPADTRMMGIAHQALRRDLARARVALAGPTAPAEAQRKTLAKHLNWMMDFLHQHHAGEDAGLYPMVAARNPAAADLLKAMDIEHAAIGPGITKLTKAAADYGRGDLAGERGRLLADIDALDATLLPHLHREEVEMMPVVSSTITVADWQAWDRRFNIKPKSFLELGREGHWLIDGLGADDRQIVVGLVSPAPRFVLLHAGFAGSYRRQKARCWGDPHGRRVQKQSLVVVTVPARPQDVMDLVADITRVGEWSHECRTGRWLGGADHAAPGARFQGRNRAGPIRWGRVCEISTVEPRCLVWRTVPTLLYPDSVEWAIRVRGTDEGTRIEQTYQVLKLPPLMDRIYATVVPSHRDRTDALVQDLLRLGRLAASTG
jgi:hemerythrin-like domain-containing protein